ncbi:sperm-associated antigen 5 isoform X2 [Pelodiscus sinensis]|uniref:sperm-associated antigen 5 isoform X2 n=1 Tax=Pelodiscus sinensis TaxID=13735 RepID=UPI003F6D94D1
MGTARRVQTEGSQQCGASGCLGAMEADSQAVGRLQRTSEIGTSHIIPIFWMTPLEWLEKNMHISVSESLRQSLPLPALQQDAGTNVTPVLSRSAGTWMTPPALLEKSTNTSAEWSVCAKDSAAETDSLLWHCSREHLSVLSRAELEGRLESTLIIIEALSCQLRDWQQSQGPVPHLGPAEQRDVLTQTDIAHPKVEEQLYHDLYLAARERLMALQRNREDEQALQQELEEAREKSWSVESQSLLDSANVSLKNLQEDRQALKQQQDQMRALLSLDQSMLDRVATKLKSCLAERDEMRSRAAEALEAKDVASTELELISGKLKEVTAELQDSLAQVDQLTVANSRLGAELSTLLRDLASLQCERDELQENHAALAEEMAQLAREQALLRQEHDRVRQELREMTECREFIDQENRVCREQLTETERELKATLAVLRERSMQFEDQKDAYQHLQKERDTLCEALDCSKVEALGLQLNRDKLLKSALELAQTKGRLLDLTDVLQAALQGEAAAAATSRSIARTPHSMPGSFVGSVLKAVAGKGTDEEAAGGWCTSAEISAEIEESLWETALELRAAVSQLVTVSSQSQKANHNEVQELQAQISEHQHQLESLESRLQAEIDARDANIAKLNKTLQVSFQAEKELQDIMRQQEKQMLQLIDRSGEVTHLKAEVSHLQHLLRRVETEARVLWEEVRGREPSVTTLDAEAVQEKVLLRQEVNKLRELLLETQRDNQEQRRIQEGKLHQTQTLLRSHEAMQEKIKEALSSIPAAVTAGSRELQNLLQYFGLKLREGARDSGDAL